MTVGSYTRSASAGPEEALMRAERDRGDAEARQPVQVKRERPRIVSAGGPLGMKRMVASRVAEWVRIGAVTHDGVEALAEQLEVCR